ncbi:hypothetical protein BLD48_08535 [Exiguobacterium sp. KRL4]|uniref:hypothetical protein n=1 Tax=Exiguobacterium sp. KRL4 TaxID=1914536 RepID=UPI0008F8D902|nr:hypothetical protein [Exiguobacterium sp. KRL4]OIN66986.1 hypothetical protein BLD48_08535 [Exiguobacterium sp. KRL4]
MILYRVLGELDDTFKWKTSLQEDTQFYAFFDETDYESATLGADDYQNGAFFLLKNFVLGFKRYPLYVHAFSGGSEISLSKVRITTKLSRGRYHHLLEICSLEEVEKYLPMAYSDAYNGQNILITMEKDVSIINDPDAWLLLAFDFSIPSKDIYYLMISHDAAGFDFVANFTEHPFQDRKIIEE